MSIENESAPRSGRLAPFGGAAPRLGAPPPSVPAPAPAPATAPAPVRRRSLTDRAEAALPAVLLAADAAAACIAVLAAHGRPWTPADLLPETGALLSALLLLNGSGGLHRSRLSPSVLDELPALAGRAAVAAALAATLAGCLGRTWPPLDTATGLLRLLAAYTVLVVLARAAAHAALLRIRRRDPRPVLVVGAGRLGRQVAATLLEHPRYGMRPVGHLDTAPVPLPDGLPVPVLGGCEVLEREVRRRGVRHLVVAAEDADAGAAAAIRAAARLGCDLWLVPGLREYGALLHGHRRPAQGDHLWGFPCLRLGRPGRQPVRRAAKRALDVAAAAVLLVLAAPLLALCALAVRLDDGPGVLFRQQRVGLGGRAFTLLKFRTLRPADEHESATRWNIAQDHRVGRVGRLLRRTSLDELPQLWNVLRGEMSLVGPRPERPYFVMRFTQAHPEYADRHRVPSGLTGLAQVHGLRGDTSIEDRTRFDNHYIESWSLWQDVKILLRTAASLIRPDGS
ncbi:exopolysaccharide biosynthesis polyprenyl glycosylphosphotransferase [Streptomyces sp. NPDC001380]|uniref:exopolysaccharide biosynthesis polyprenyl glycosylphosphotransferase n=1 Tax=Streptomyces sp. NPDC001380 TaxID=3364566 RepID=UPI0036CCF5DF